MRLPPMQGSLDESLLVSTRHPPNTTSLMAAMYGQDAGYNNKQDHGYSACFI